MGKGIKLFVVSFTGVITFCGQVAGQVQLRGAGYTQNFDSIGGGLPAGWSVWMDATESDLGTAASFETNTTSWADSTAEFRNCASVTNNSGVFAADTGSSAQHAFTNRVLAVRQGSGFGDPDAAFVLQVANTTGISNLQFSADFMMLDDEGRETVWTVDYGLGITPTTFTLLGTYTNGGVPGTIGRPTLGLGADANDQSDVVTVRVAALEVSTGSGSRDTFGVDNVRLDYEGAAVASIPLHINWVGSAVVLTWNDPLFTLQSATNLHGPYVDVTSLSPTHHECDPNTNAFTDQTYFRLIKR